MARLVRLDTELVRRKLAADKPQARYLIKQGCVTVDALPADNPATRVSTAAALVVKPASDSQAARFVSRGGKKLDGALRTFAADGLSVSGRRCLDVGASTGGFTDALLQAGAATVAAADVAYGELAWTLRNDPRVKVLERTHVKDLTLEKVGGPVDLIVADLSFISLSSVLPHLLTLTSANTDIVVMVKPQFELPADLVPPGGVVRSPRLHLQAVSQVIAAAAAEGWGIQGVVASQLPGPAGNLEFFTWFRRGKGRLTLDQVSSAMAATAAHALTP